MCDVSKACSLQVCLEHLILANICYLGVGTPWTVWARNRPFFFFLNSVPTEWIRRHKLFCDSWEENAVIRGRELQLSCKNRSLFRMQEINLSGLLWKEYEKWLILSGGFSTRLEVACTHHGHTQKGLRFPHQGNLLFLAAFLVIFNGLCCNSS